MYRLLSGMARYTTGTARDGVSLTALAYHNDWDATDQIASRAVPGLYDRLGTVDPTVGGVDGSAWPACHRGEQCRHSRTDPVFFALFSGQ